MGKTGLGKVFGNVLHRKQAFLDYKNIDFWVVAKLEFFKGVNPWDGKTKQRWSIGVPRRYINIIPSDWALLPWLQRSVLEILWNTVLILVGTFQKSKCRAYLGECRWSWVTIPTPPFKESLRGGHSKKRGETESARWGEGYTVYGHLATNEISTKKSTHTT